MEIYLVRHGETGGNVARRHQSEETQLSFLGEQQVKDAAGIIKQYQPTHLITSNLVRTIETARIIGEACDLIPETSYKFVELVRPKHMYGHHHRSLKSVWFYFQWFLGKGSSITEGGESYQDLLQRLKLAKEHLAQYPKDARVVVVSHAVFINFFVAHMCREKALNPLAAALVFKKIITMPNANITPIIFDEDDDVGDCAWSVNN